MREGRRTRRRTRISANTRVMIVEGVMFLAFFFWLFFCLAFFSYFSSWAVFGTGVFSFFLGGGRGLVYRMWATGWGGMWE